jgi:hypothetical protein
MPQGVRQLFFDRRGVERCLNHVLNFVYKLGRDAGVGPVATVSTLSSHQVGVSSIFEISR